MAAATDPEPAPLVFLPCVQRIQARPFGAQQTKSLALRWAARAISLSCLGFLIRGCSGDRQIPRNRLLPPAISLVLAPSLLPEFLHGPVNDERRLGIRFFRFRFDWFSHSESLERTYTELLALTATKH